MSQHLSRQKLAGAAGAGGGHAKKIMAASSSWQRRVSCVAIVR